MRKRGLASGPEGEPPAGSPNPDDGSDGKAPGRTRIIRRRDGTQHNTSDELAATARIVVVPFGYAEVNGRRGRAPLDVQLPAGTYTIRAGVGPERLSRRQEVLFAPGERREIVIDLGGNE